jgi:hypothetical protein
MFECLNLRWRSAQEKSVAKYLQPFNNDEYAKHLDVQMFKHLNIQTSKSTD